MFNQVGPVLFHVLIVLFPILVYHLYFTENKVRRKKPYSKLIIILLLILILTMSFPIEYDNGYFYDFRVIPIVIAFLYGGTIPGILMIIVLLVFRFNLGGAGFYVTLLNYSIASAILTFVVRKYDKVQLRTKVIIVSVVYWLMALTRALTLIKMNQLEQIPFMLAFSMITWVTLVMVVFLIENVNEQQALRQELQRADKLNVISQLAASVAHEVRNPMTSVRGFLQLMNDDTNLLPSQKNYIRIALNELDHAQSIINDYLSLAKPHTEGLAWINITEELKNIIELMSSYSNIQNISIHKSVQDALFVKGNKAEIKQVLVNIIKNGIEAMESGGSITVNAYDINDSIKIEIIDNGKGMTKAQLKQLGTPFYSTKEKGTGVGLTISFQIIQSMKGTILVNSEIGKGTTFTIQIPKSIA
ncbi:sensor histidine kinase [Peribacillus alkalitolerans]|uniref:sensor histidine kinase n=1 Tax=Peribacillus alkalitolerans TaxID=1550385 RepID=UPI0013D4D06A|nr:HAMP domain-containing sensor histidine kinase [Peribacillus alkalitolerans]